MTGKAGRGAVLIGLSAVALAGAGCGSSSSSKDSASSAPSGPSKGIAEAKANVEAAKALPAFRAPGKPFDASKARSKVVAILPDYPALPFVQEINQGLKEASTAAGIKLKDCPNNGTVGDWVKCFNQGINAKPDLILLNGSPSPSQLQPQIAKAKAAGIPVVANHVPLDSEFPPGTLPATNTTGLTGVEAGPFPKAARLEADYALANQPGGKVNALLLTSNEAPASRGLIKMIQNELAAKCGGGCKTTVVNVPIVDWATKLQDATRTGLLKDPKINWVIPVYDGMYQFVLPGIQSAGRNGKVKTVSFNGQGGALTAIAKGAATATAGENLAWTGWSTVDQILRILATGKPTVVKTADTPIRIWDKSNISQAGSPPDPTSGYGESYKQKFLQLWGIKG